MKNNKEYLLVTGEVIEILGNGSFRIRCDNETKVIAYISAEFKSKKKRGISSKINVGSRLKIKLSLNDLNRGSIVGFSNSLI